MFYRNQKTLLISPILSFANLVTTPLHAHQAIAILSRICVFLIQLLISFLRLPAALLDAFSAMVSEKQEKRFPLISSIQDYRSDEV